MPPISPKQSAGKAAAKAAKENAHLNKVLNKPAPAVPGAVPVQARPKTPPATLKLEFLLKASITAVIRNAAGLEERRTFNAVFEIDRAGIEKPWYVLKNFLAPQFLNAHLGVEGVAWLRIYEAKTEKIVNRANPQDIDGIPVRVMTIDQLEIYTKTWDYPVRVREFPTIQYARQMVSLYEEDPSGYEKQYAAYVSGQGRQMPELDRYRKAAAGQNPDVLAKEFDSLMSSPAQTPVPAGPKAAEVSGPLSAEEQAALETPSENLPPAETSDSVGSTAAPGNVFGNI